jgi:hypothetical protein
MSEDFKLKVVCSKKITSCRMMRMLLVLMTQGTKELASMMRSPKSRASVLKK